MSDEVTWNPVSLIPAQPGTRALYVAECNSGEWYCKPVIVWALVEKMTEDGYGRLEESPPAEYRRRDIVAMVIGHQGGLERAASEWDEDGIRFDSILEPGQPMPESSELARWEAAKKRFEDRERWRFGTSSEVEAK